jgi:hypothetical protein
MADKETSSALSRRSFLKIAAAAGAAAAASAAGLSPALAARPAPGTSNTQDKMDTPTIECAGSTQTSIEIKVCGGSTTGAPAGFTIQWMTADECKEKGWPDGVCDASFSGEARDSGYSLGLGQCVTVDIGNLTFDNGVSTSCPEELHCGTEYVFRAFAHANRDYQRSDWTHNLTCSTASCGGGCVHSQGYWGNKPGVVWPDPYSRDATFFLSGKTWQQVMDASVSGSPGYYQLAQQYIAAVLNQANGAPVPTDVQNTLGLAQSWFGAHDPDVCTGPGSCGTQKEWASILEQYNTGEWPGGPGHCEE